MKFPRIPLHFILITCLTLIVCLIISWHGLSRETVGNSVYINLISTFPQRLNLRIEPLFVTLLWLTSFIGGPVVSILLWRFILVWLQLFFLYLFFKAINFNKGMTLVGLTIYASSTVTFGLADNLLRNDAALTLSLGLLAWFLWLLKKQGPLLWHWFLLGVGLGALFYTHLFMAVIMCAVFIGVFFLFTIRFAMRKFTRVVSFRLFSTGVFLTLCTAFIIFLPYLQKLQSNTRLDDYRQEDLGKKVAEPIEITDTDNTDPQNGTPAITTEPPTASLKSKIIRVFRFAFEYRDISLPTGLILFTAISLLIMARNWRTNLNRPEILIAICLWGVTYFGTKLDFFGIGVIPYRFSLILSLASLLIILLSFNDLMPRLTSKNARKLLVIAFMASFIGHNLPLIAESFLLKHQDFSVLQKHAEQAVVNRSVPQGSRITQLGTSIESFRPDLVTIDLRTPFETNNQQKAFKSTLASKIEYLILTDAIQNQRASLDSQSVTYHWENLLKNPRFELVDIELFGPHAIYLLKINAEQTTPGYAINSYPVTNNEALSLLEQIDRTQIKSWNTRIHNQTLWEEIRLPHQLIRLKYPEGSVTTSHSLVTKVTYLLKPIPLRETITADRWQSIEKTGSVLSFSSPSNNQTYIQLSDYSRDTLTVTSQVSQDKSVATYFLSRSTFRFLIHVFVAIFGLLLYWRLRDKHEGRVTKEVYLIAAFLLLDLVIFSQLFFQSYVSLFS